MLWCNWRDIKNPDAGGAEVLIHQIMLRLAQKGHSIVLFTSQFKNSLPNENIDGVEIIRAGGKYSVYRKAKEYLIKNIQYFDLFVDSVNTIPFLSPKFVSNKTLIPIIYQRTLEIWSYELFFPLNYVFRLLEGKWFSRYKETPTVTISNSSKKDLEAIGFKRIFVIPVGSNVQPLSELPLKESEATLVFLGRLKKYKLPDHALRAFSIIRDQIPGARLWVIGSGSMVKKLKNKFNVQGVTFYGYINEETKYELLRKAHLILVPGVREGWGLVVTESNAMGTPAIAYDVPGLRDSVKDGNTGVLIHDRSEEAMARAAIALLKDKDLLRKYSENALTFARQLTWDNAANEFEKIINTLKH